MDRVTDPYEPLLPRLDRYQRALLEYLTAKGHPVTMRRAGFDLQLPTSRLMEAAQALMARGILQRGTMKHPDTHLTLRSEAA